MAADEGMALELKKRGNDAYKSGNYERAISIYTEALEHDETCVPVLGNRAAARMMLEQWERALDDCQRAIRADATFAKAYNRGAKCLLRLGRLEESAAMYTQALLRDPCDENVRNDRQLVELTRQRLQRARTQVREGRGGDAVRLLTVIRQEVTASVEVDLLAAEAQMAAGQVDEAMSLVTDMARKHPTSSKVLHLRAKGLFMQGNFPRALTHLQEALALDPDNEDVKNLFRTIKRVERKKKEGNDAFKAGRVQEAIDSYTECLEHVGTGNGPFRATVLCNRAAARMKQSEWTKAVDDCNKCIELDESYLKGYTRRAQCLRQMGEKEDLEQAVRDLETAQRLATDRETARGLQADLRAAKKELKNAARKDYYKILAVSHDADDRAIKKAYRKGALKWHPDRHSSATEEEQRRAEKMFKDVNEAYNVLSDPVKRRKYDMGADLETIEQGGDGMDMGGGMAGGGVPMDIFEAFFGGGMGGPGMGGGVRFGGRPAGGVRFG